jgi:deoxyhypusine synthase
MLHPKRRIRPRTNGEGLSRRRRPDRQLLQTLTTARGLREACQTFARMIDDGTTIGVSIAGALTPAGLSSVLVPLMQAGFIDYISSTGANLYHDLHFDLDLALYRGQPDVVSGAHDVSLRKDGVIRVYDVLFPADVLYKTDEWLYRVMMSPEFRKRISGSELHHLIGKYALATARKLGVQKPSLLATAHELDLPIWVASPGDSTIGLNLAAIYTASPERGPHLDPAAGRDRDVGAGAGRQAHARRQVGRRSSSAAARPRTSCCRPSRSFRRSSACPSAATTTSSRSPTRVPTRAACRAPRPPRPCRGARSIRTCCPTPSSATSTPRSAMPLIASYVLARCKPRKPRRLYKRLKEMEQALRAEYLKSDLYKRYWPDAAADAASAAVPARRARPDHVAAVRQTAPPHATLAAARPTRRLGVKRPPCSTTSHRWVSVLIRFGHIMFGIVWARAPVLLQPGQRSLPGRPGQGAEAEGEPEAAAARVLVVPVGRDVHVHLWSAAVRIQVHPPGTDVQRRGRPERARPRGSSSACCWRRSCGSTCGS